LQGSIVDWQTIGTLAGACMLGATGLWAVGGVLATRRRMHTRRERAFQHRSHFEEKVEAALKWARAAKLIFRAWSGERTFRVAAIVEEASDCRSYYLVPADGRSVARFEPGQYLTFRLQVDAHLRPVVRCYSLSDRPREDYYRVTVKQLGPPAGRDDLPPGQGSAYFHRSVRVGSKLQVQAPQGGFFLDPTETSPLVLIAGGIGITPIFSMLSAILHERSPRKVFVFAGFRNSGEHPLRDALREMGNADNVHLDVSYSQPLPHDLLYRDFQQHGHVNISRLRQVLPSSNFRYYVCGPAGMMESLVPALRNWGVPDSHIHFEAFGPASVQRMNHGAEQLARVRCRVEFTQSEQELNWDGTLHSLLELGERAGLVLDSGCRAGNCGQCRVAVRSGKVMHLKQPGIPLVDGECLTCIGIPQSDVILDA